MCEPLQAAPPATEAGRGRQSGPSIRMCCHVRGSSVAALHAYARQEREVMLQFVCLPDAATPIAEARLFSRVTGTIHRFSQLLTSLVSLEEFIMGCMRVRGPARAMDFAKLEDMSRWMMRRLMEIKKDLDRQAGPAVPLDRQSVPAVPAWSGDVNPMWC